MCFRTQHIGKLNPLAAVAAAPAKLHATIKYSQLPLKTALIVAGLTLVAISICGCGPREHLKTQIQLNFTPPSKNATIGTTPLNLGETLFINHRFAWRDGFLHVPESYSADTPVPLLIWLHGGGGSATDAHALLPVAEDYGVVVLALDSRHNTWDGIDSAIGPDVEFLQSAMQYTLDHVAVDRDRVALGGLSDGGTYALALGRTNGHTFTHLVGVSPWRMKSPAPPVGAPRIFVAHGLRDTVYPEPHTRYVVVPELKKSGYDVVYFPFDGPHWVTDDAWLEIVRWLVGD
jgi:phospholipase/carboxylesterase